MPEEKQKQEQEERKDEILNNQARPGFKRLARLQRKEEFLPSFSRSFLSFAIEVVKVVVISLAIIVPIRYFFIQPFYVRGASMEPTFHDNEYLIINEIGYRFSAPQRGDIVVIKSKSNPREYLIKRIVGLPGEKIEIASGQVIVHKTDQAPGVAIQEKYLAEGTSTAGNNIIILKEGEYYVLGDNRSSSLDSRSFGAVNRNEIIGRAWLRAWPFYKMRHFSSPEYNL